MCCRHPQIRYIILATYYLLLTTYHCLPTADCPPPLDAPRAVTLWADVAALRLKLQLYGPAAVDLEHVLNMQQVGYDPAAVE